MIIKYLNEKHIEKIHLMQSEYFYKTPLDLDIEEYEETFSKSKNKEPIAYGVFLKGELKAYILAVKDTKTNIIHIDDIMCLNPAYILKLLIVFFSENEGVYTAECVDKSNRLLLNFVRNYPKIVDLEYNRFIPNYYGEGYSAYKVKFKINNPLINHKYRIIYEIYKNKKTEKIKTKKIIKKLKEEHIDIGLYENFITRNIKDRNRF